MSFVWLAAIALSIAGSVLGLLTASLLLLVDYPLRSRIVPWLVSYAVGTLLGAALLGLLPQALESLPPPPVFGALLAGILTFFVLEKLVLWRHSHDGHECDVHKATATLVIVGDMVHTFVDGIVIAAATLVSVPFGATTALAVAAHEIPQEAGDFAILLAAGYSRTRALVLNFSSAIGGVARRRDHADLRDARARRRPVRAGVRGREFPLRRDGRPDPDAAPRHDGQERRPPASPHRRRDRDDHPVVEERRKYEVKSA